MFKKFTALLLLTSFTHAFAMAPVQETSAMAKALERTFDEMNYSLNVEWDQKDQQFFKTTVDGFEKEIQSLQTQGLTNKELVEFTLAKIKDKQLQNDVREIAKTINDESMSTDEARNFALEKLSGGYSQGASWSGSRMGIKLVLILGVIILICCATKGHDNDDNDRPERPHCRDNEWDSRSYQGGGWDQCNDDDYYPYPQAV